MTDPEQRRMLDAFRAEKADDQGTTHYAGDGCDPPHDDPGLWRVEDFPPAEASPAVAIEARLRDDLDNIRAVLRNRREQKQALADEIRLLVEAEEVVIAALSPFNRRAKAKAEAADDGG